MDSNQIIKHKNLRNTSVLFYSIGLLALFLVSCGSSKVSEPRGAEEVFKEAKTKFDDKDYYESQQLFELIKLQYPASQYADDAQYYLGEVNYKKHEYILAQFNYAMLRRSYPSSKYYKTCVFKSALCYYELSPEYDRDQEYTFKAIQAFSEFQAMYPNDSLYKVATNYIKELREKLANRVFATAVLYRKLLNPNSASIYYDYVIKDYPDTQFYEPAYLGKIETLFQMKKYDEARSLIDLYLSKFPNGQYKINVTSLLKEMISPNK